METQQKSYFAVIPASVRYDKRLKPLSRLLYGEITALSNEKGYCWATNSYFAELYSVSNDTISRSIKQLEKFEYIKCIYDKSQQNNDKRKIYIKYPKSIDKISDTVSSKNTIPYTQNFPDGIRKNSEHNNTNNNINNKIEKDALTSSHSNCSFDLFVKELCIVFEYFTAKTATSLCQLDGFKTSQKREELYNAFNNRRYDWYDCIQYSKTTVDGKTNQNLTTRWLDFLSYLRIFLRNGDEKNHNIKKYYTPEELSEITKQRHKKELEKIKKEEEEKQKQLELDKDEAYKRGMTLEEYYKYCEEAGDMYFNDLKKALRGY